MPDEAKFFVNNYEQVALSQEELKAKVREYADDAEALGLEGDDAELYTAKAVISWLKETYPGIPFEELP